MSKEPFTGKIPHALVKKLTIIKDFKSEIKVVDVPNTYYATMYCYIIEAKFLYR